MSKATAFCQYNQKKQIYAFLLEFFIPAGAGHLYAKRTLSGILKHMDQVRIWNIYCIRPCDSGYANAFDKRKVKNQVKSLLLPENIQRRQILYLNYKLSCQIKCLAPGLK